MVALGVTRKWHDGFVDDDRSDRQFLRAGVADMEIDLVPFESISFHVKVFDGHRRFQIQSAAGGEEERDHSSEQNDWDEKQDEGPER